MARPTRPLTSTVSYAEQPADPRRLFPVFDLVHAELVAQRSARLQAELAALRAAGHTALRALQGGKNTSERGAEQAEAFAAGVLAWRARTQEAAHGQ